MKKISFRKFNFVLIHIVVISYIIADSFFRDSAFESSNNFAVSLQKSLNSKFFEIFFIVFCDILYPIVTAVILMTFYALTVQKIKTLAFFLYFFLITYVCSILKLIYHNPRPYWVSPNVEALECYSEYGNPSGHSMMSIIFFGMIWHEYVWVWVEKGQVGVLSNWQKEQRQMNENLIKDEKDKIAENNTDNKTCRFLLFSLLIALVMFFILFGRIYLGMHSYNEVFLGFLYGFYFIYLYLTYFEDIFVAFIHSIIIKNAHDINESLHYVSWMLFGILFALYMFFLIIPVITFEACKSNSFIPDIWYQRIKKACPSNDLFKMFHYKCFIDCGVISTAFGILFGMIFTRGKHSIVLQAVNSNENAKSVLKNMARICVVLLVCGGVAFAFQKIPNNNDIYIAYFINSNLGTFLGGLGLIKLVPFIFYKLNIDFEGDFLQYHNGEMVVTSEMDHENIEVQKKTDIEMISSQKNDEVASNSINN